MIFEDVLSLIHLAHIESIDIVIFIGGNKVEGLHGVPSNRIRPHGQDQLCDGLRSTKVIQDNRPVRSCGRQDISLGLVELDSVDGINSPVEGLDWLSTVVIPDIDLRSRGCKHVVGAMMRDSREGILAGIGRHRQMNRL